MVDVGYPLTVDPNVVLREAKTISTANYRYRNVSAGGATAANDVTQGVTMSYTKGASSRNKASLNTSKKSQISLSFVH